MIDVNVVLAILWLVEAGGRLYPLDGAAGEVGPYQITKEYLTDVNQYYGTELTHKDCQNLTKARWVVYSYLKMWDALDTVEHACRVHKGGPQGLSKESTLAYWIRCHCVWNGLRALSRENPDDGFHPTIRTAASRARQSSATE